MGMRTLRHRLLHQPRLDPTDLADRTDRPAPPAPQRCAYTLLEMLMVLFIVGLLVTVVVGLYQHSQDAANRRRAVADLGTLHQAIDAFYLEFGRYPLIPDPATTNLLDLAVARERLANTPGSDDEWATLAALPEPPGDWFELRLPEGFTAIDPWRNPYQYVHDIDIFDAYALFSLGPDGQKGTPDDLYFQP